MGRFETTVRTDDVLEADPQAIWDVMHQPDLLADMAPAVDRITVDGDRWCWRMTGISAMGQSVAPSFTERMAFDEDAMRIDFAHAPGHDRTEAAGASGHYLLVAVPEGAYVGIELTAHVDLPLPRAVGSAVRKVMERTIVIGGRRFADNLLAHVGGRSLQGLQVVDADAPWPRAEQAHR